MNLPAALRRLGRLALIAAVLISGGTHWMVLQSVAWAAMLVERAHDRPIVEAVKTTFDGSDPCPLCKSISAARENEKSGEQPSLLAKVDLFYQTPTAVLRAPRPGLRWDRPLSCSSERLAHPPALPPPRLG